MNSRMGWSSRLFSIDLRSLALFRIAVAVIMLCDLVFLRFPDLDAFYADDGMFSVQDAKNWLKGTGAWSLCLRDGSAAFQTAMFGLAFVFSAGLLLGWMTRLMTVGCWVMAVSIANRNPLVCNYGDTMLQVFLFWSMFLPLGAKWSLDARRKLRWKTVSSNRRVYSAASAAALLQLSFIYFFTAVWKWNTDWLEGSAAETALQLEYARRATSLDSLIGRPFLQPLTMATLALELVGPLVIWLPWRTSFFRSAMIVSFFLLHFSIELLFTPVLLSYMCVAAWFLFLPSAFWDSPWIQRILGEPSESISETPIAAPKASSKSARYRRRLANGICLSCLSFVLLWNLSTLPFRKFEVFIPQDLRWLGPATTLAQKWDMFYRPSRHNGWHKARARLADGSVVDVLRDGEPFDADLLESNWAYHRSGRWKLFFRRLGIWNPLASLGDKVASSLLDDWNSCHPESQHAVELQLLYYERLKDSLGDGFTVQTCGSAVTVSEPDWESLFDPLERLIPDSDPQAFHHGFDTAPPSVCDCSDFHPPACRFATAASWEFCERFPVLVHREVGAGVGLDCQFENLSQRRASDTDRGEFRFSICGLRRPIPAGRHVETPVDEAGATFAKTVSARRWPSSGATAAISAAS